VSVSPGYVVRRDTPPTSRSVGDPKRQSASRRSVVPTSIRNGRETTQALPQGWRWRRIADDLAPPRRGGLRQRSSLPAWRPRQHSNLDHRICHPSRHPSVTRPSTEWSPFLMVSGSGLVDTVNPRGKASASRRKASGTRREQSGVIVAAHPAPPWGRRSANSARHRARSLTSFVTPIGAKQPKVVSCSRSTLIMFSRDRDFVVAPGGPARRAMPLRWSN
jgi:hypothetical protein